MAQRKHKITSLYSGRIIGQIVLAAIFIWSATVAARHTLSGLERAVFQIINGWPDILRWPMLGVTQLGSVWLLVFLVIYEIHQRRKEFALKLLLFGSSAHVLVDVFKRFIDRPRPEYIYAETMVRELHVAGNGFPSGHAAMASVAAAILWNRVPAERRWLLIIWVLSVMVSRVYLGVHSPLDVIGGACFGLLSVPYFNIAWKYFRQKVIRNRQLSRAVKNTFK